MSHLRGVANAFGLYDMHGNAWEWCADCGHKDYEGAPTDDSTWLAKREDTTRLGRGGSWLYNPGNCRSAYRYYFNSVFRTNGLGFQVVCGLARSSWHPKITRAGWFGKFAEDLSGSSEIG